MSGMLKGLGVTDHGLLKGLNDDDHGQYVANAIARTITAVHTFNPSAAGAAFTLGANATGQLITGLNAELWGGATFSNYLDQAVKTTSSPTFVGITLSGLTASRLMATNGSKALSSVADLTAWIAGTTNRITATSDGDGTITLSSPQDINTGATVTFANVYCDRSSAAPSLRFYRRVDADILWNVFVGSDKGMNFNSITPISGGVSAVPFLIYPTGVQIGNAEAGIDYTLTFRGQSSTGILTFMEDESRLDFDQSIALKVDSKKLYLGAGYDVSIYYDGTNGYIKTDEVAPSDLHATCGAAKTFVLDTTVYKDMQFKVSYGKVGATNIPTWETFTTNTAEYSFTVDDYIDLPADEMPHSWKEGTNGSVHLHAAIKTANSAGADRFAKFTVYLAYADVNEVWTETSVTAELTIPNGTTALTHQLLTVGTLTLTNQLIGNQIKARVKRIAATGGTEYADNVFITQVGIHVENDTIGSRAVASK